MQYLYQDQTVSIEELRLIFRNISFPSEPSEADLTPLGVTLVPDPAPTPEELLVQAKAARLSRLGEAFETAQQESHFGSSLGFEVDATERANRDVTGLITVLEATAQTKTGFCDYGNTMHAVTLVQLRTLQLEIIVYGQMLYARKWQLREAINAAETPEAVASIEINFDSLPAPQVTA